MIVLLSKTHDRRIEDGIHVDEHGNASIFNRFEQHSILCYGGDGKVKGVICCAELRQRLAYTHVIKQAFQLGEVLLCAPYGSEPTRCTFDRQSELQDLLE